MKKLLLKTAIAALTSLPFFIQLGTPVLAASDPDAKQYKRIYAFFDSTQTGGYKNFAESYFNTPLFTSSSSLAIQDGPTVTDFITLGTTSFGNYTSNSTYMTVGATQDCNSFGDITITENGNEERIALKQTSGGNGDCGLHFFYSSNSPNSNPPYKFVLGTGTNFTSADTIHGFQVKYNGSGVWVARFCPVNCNNAYATIGSSNIGGSSGLPFFSQGA